MMSKFSCEKCGKEFNRKSQYSTHLTKKTPCAIAIEDESKIGRKELNDASDIDIEESCVGNDSNKPMLVKDIAHKKITVPKPILKWVGGKTQILDKLMPEFPTNMDNYREIFLGGGSVLLALLSHVKNGVIKIRGNIYAYDLNEPLVYMYKNIQSSHNELYNQLRYFISEFNSCGNGGINREPKNADEAKMARENYYYWIRSEYNKLTDKKTIIGSAMFIFLNKTCFRGVFRVGPNGFNVPYGHYTNPEIINKEHLDEIHDLTQNVIFECCDFNTSVNNTKPNDYVYLDPPYAPETDTSFVGYTKNGFNKDEHVKLFNLIHELTETNIKMMMSNADVALGS
jgi:DNA adenine methylase